MNAQNYAIRDVLGASVKQFNLLLRHHVGEHDAGQRAENRSATWIGEVGAWRAAEHGYLGIDLVGPQPNPSLLGRIQDEASIGLHALEKLVHDRKILGLELRPQHVVEAV